MENWLNEIELKGEIVTLLPMRAEHGALLAEAAEMVIYGGCGIRPCQILVRLISTSKML